MVDHMMINTLLQPSMQFWLQSYLWKAVKYVFNASSISEVLESVWKVSVPFH